MFLISTLSSREQLADLLNERGLLGYAVEIGTHRGNYAKAFLDRWKGSMLFCVDPYSSPCNVPAVDQASTIPTTQAGDSQIDDPQIDDSRNDDYRAAVGTLGASHAGRFHFRHLPSTQAAREMPDGLLDFVYIDGDHSYQSVARDLATWWPKLRVSGILAGHDIMSINETNGGYSRAIQRAVIEFAGLGNNRDVYLIREDASGPWSFYLFKE